MNNDLIRREYLEDAFDNLCCHNCKICRNFRNEDSFYKCALIDNAPTVEAYTYEQIKELADKLYPDRMTKPEKAKVGEIVRAYTKGFDTGADTVRSQGELKKVNKVKKND